MIANISDQQTRGDDAKPVIEGSELAQKRLEGKLTQASFLWTWRILERLYYDDFKKCPQCGQSYWRGSHIAKLEQRVEKILNQVPC